jgi:phosphoglucosamine mutase
LSDELEAEIERRMENPEQDDNAEAQDLGKASRLGDSVGRYVEYVKRTFPNGNLEGLRIVIDCANGAAYKVAPTVLWELGAEVIPVAVTPNGRNINHGCGATHPQLMQEAVLLHGADVGIALDGDADRLIMADEKGQRIDGDQLMALVASSWAEQGRLRGNALVATVMSNLGLERFLQSKGIVLHRTAIGDRYVVEGMRQHDCNLGGEQSGHVVMSDYGTTGDGLMTALQILALIKKDKRLASTVCNLFTPLPQILSNVRAHAAVLDNPKIIAAIGDAEKRLEGRGRLLIRKSGTEPLIRVMAEGDDATLVQNLVDSLVEAIKVA